MFQKALHAQVAETFDVPPESVLWRPDFLLGVATAAYQIEGAVGEDGRLPSIWDTFSATPGKVLRGDTGAVACDHYHRWRDDVELIASLGVDAYRLSIAWPRVMDRDGRANAKGIDFYRGLLRALREKGIRTSVTLYHWDLPQHLEDAGGWCNRETAFRFAEYADLVSRELAGLVDYWSTLNEPWCSAMHGYGTGHHAPGHTSVVEANAAMHHLLLGHGLALQALRRNDPGSQKGIVLNVGRGTTDGALPEDRRAAELFELQHNDWVLDPLLRGSYPQALYDELWPGAEPPVRDGDLAIIAAPLDFLGINYYFRTNVRAGAGGGYAEVDLEGVERTQMGWEVYPEGLSHLLVDFHRRYPNLPPIYITENGMACDDEVVDGQVVDGQRIAFLNRHLAAVDRAVKTGVDVRGYYIWSLMDNFEWAFGYERRFGIVHVDYGTQRRTVKRSAELVRDFLARRKAQS